MSALAEQARSKAKEKVERLTRSNTGKVDASGWREPLGEKANVQTGPRPVSRRQFRRGGKVHGEHGAMHAGRKPRASGGMTANEYLNRNVKTANESRDGEKQDGGMKHGGACKCSKCGGGSVGRKEGGRLTDHPDVFSAAKGRSSRPAQNLAQSAMKMTAKQGSDPYNSQPAQAKAYKSLWSMKGGRPGRKEGGSVSYGGSRPEGGRIARAHGGRSKKGTTVNIIIAPGGGAPKPMMPPPGAPPPPGGPPGMHQGMPPPMPPGGAPSPMGPPMMGRKHGGRAYPIEHGAGGGKGRLEKARAYGG
jgi:hypothetical protein